MGLFGKLSGFPGKVKKHLESEGIVIIEEGVTGEFIADRVKGSGKSYLRTRKGFSGSLAVTRRRVVFYAFRKPQISLAFDDPRIARLSVGIRETDAFSISFESSDFREGWSGRVEFLFRTGKAREFHDALTSAGAGSTGAI